jgi:hypothetical protein
MKSTSKSEKSMAKFNDLSDKIILMILEITARFSTAQSEEFRFPLHSIIGERYHIPWFWTWAQQDLEAIDSQHAFEL